MDPFNPEVLSDTSPFDDMQPGPAAPGAQIPPDPADVPPDGAGEKKPETPKADETVEDRLKRAGDLVAADAPKPDDVLLQKLEEINKKVETVEQKAFKLQDPQTPADKSKEPSTWDDAYEEAKNRTLAALDEKERAKQEQAAQAKRQQEAEDAQAQKVLAHQLAALKKEGLITTKEDELELLHVAFELKMGNVIDAYKPFADRRELAALKAKKVTTQDAQDRKKVLGLVGKGGTVTPPARPGVNPRTLRTMSMGDMAELAKRA
jgi:hypothetical protein